MVAIGSYFDQREDAQRYSLILLETATKLLRRRDSITSRARLADLQTVFLLEVLSKYFSRRIEVDMSARFRSLFASLDQARRSLATNPLAVFRTLRKNHTKEDLIKAHKFWVEHETRRRILQASAVLDMQQVVLFEQPATIVRHSGRTRLNTDCLRTHIALPCDEELWNMSPIEKWTESAKTYEYIDPTTSRTSYQRHDRAEVDYFQMQVQKANDSAIPNHGSYNSQNNMTLKGTPFSIGCADFNDRAFVMARHTPVHHLLLVSGESWIFGKKLESESDFQASKQALRRWVDAKSDSLTALWHATTLIRTQITFRSLQSSGSEAPVVFETKPLLHEPWALYLATLVCWAYGYGMATPLSNSGTFSRAASIASEPTTTSTSSAAHPALLDPSEAAADMQDYLQATNVPDAGDLASISGQTLSRTHGLLETVRIRKLAPMIGGLMNEAERVLFRLVEGRSRLSHF